MGKRVDPDTRRLGNRIRTLREAKGLSQERLAEDAEIHRTYLSGIERGVRNPSFKNLVKIAAALDVPVVELFEMK